MVKPTKTNQQKSNTKIKPSTRITVGAYDWLMTFGLGLKDNTGGSVPCGDCDACCRAGYAIRTNDGKLYLPRKDGTCPKLQCGLCSVYEDRPRTCKYYDCRTHFFSGIDSSKTSINTALKQWRVTTSTERDKAVIDVIKTVAEALADCNKSPEDIAVQSCLIAYERIFLIE